MKKSYNLCKLEELLKYETFKSNKTDFCQEFNGLV